MDALLHGAHAVRGQHQLPHPVPDDHHRARLDAAVLSRCAGCSDARRRWLSTPTASGPRSSRCRFALGVVSGITMSFQFGTNWPGYMETRRRHRRAAARLRSADRVLPRGELPRHHAVRPWPSQRARAPRGDVPGRLRHHAQRVLDPGPRTRGCRRPAGYEIVDGIVHVTELARDPLQPVVPVPLRAHAARLGADGRFLLAGLSAPGRLLRGVGQRVGAARRCASGLTLAAIAAPAADLRRRPARPQHARAPAAEDRGDGRHLEHRARRAAAAVRDARPRRTKHNDFEIAIPALAPA